MCTDTQVGRAGGHVERAPITEPFRADILRLGKWWYGREVKGYLNVLLRQASKARDIISAYAE